ncbi:MAG: glycosyltransferase [Nitrososphaerales archaeon]
MCAFPSLYEPFEIVSFEAMAMEKPVVVGAKGVVGLLSKLYHQVRIRTESCKWL